MTTSTKKPDLSVKPKSEKPKVTPKADKKKAAAKPKEPRMTAFDKSAQSVAEDFGIDGVKTRKDLEAALEKAGWVHVDLKGGKIKATPEYKHRLAAFRGLALPEEAIGVGTRGYLTHTKDFPSSDKARIGIASVWVKDKTFTETTFWAALDAQQIEIYGRNYHIDDDGEVVWIDPPEKVEELEKKLETAKKNQASK